MRNQKGFLALTLSSLLLAGSLAAQSPTPTQDEAASTQTAPEPANVDSTAPPVTSDQPLNTEPLLQENATATESAEPPAETPPAAQSASGKATAVSASALDVEVDASTTLTFVVDYATTEPSEVHVGDQVLVEYATLSDGSHHANRVTIAAPVPAETAPVVVDDVLVVPPAAARKPHAKPATPPHQAAVPAAKPTVEPVAVPAPAEPLAASSALSGASEVTTTTQDSSATPDLVVPVASSNVAKPNWLPRRMLMPFLFLIGGLTFLITLGIKQVRREA